MPRFFLEPAQWSGSPALTGDEARHCARVLRAREGDVVTVFDGEGRSSEAEILKLSRDRIDLRLGDPRHEPVPKVKVVLAQAVIKGKAMDWLLQKAVELGVSEIQPLATDHSVVQPGEGKEEKWQRAVLEACKQCGRSRVPKVLPVLDFGEFIKNTCSGVQIIASLGDEAKPLKECLSAGSDSEEWVFLIGPEGDFSPSEYAEALEAGWIQAHLGSAVLRSETAAIYCLSAAAYAIS